MLQWCVDNLVTMEVSLSEQGLSCCLILYFQHTVAYELRDYGGIINVANIYIDKVSCTGNEMKLVDCNINELDSYTCSQGCNAAAVICTGKLIGTVKPQKGVYIYVL